MIWHKVDAIKLSVQSFITPFNTTMTLTKTLLLLFAVLLCGSGCRQKSQVAKASRELASRITQSSPSQSPGTNAPQVEESRIYLDASLSMKGFVNPQDYSTFDEFIDELGDALPGCRLYRYGQSGGRPPENPSELVTQVGFGLELHRPEFYNLSYNPDDRLIDTFANENRPILSVLITDGVYSETAGSTSPPVVNAILKWLQSGRVLAIFQLKSAFDGPFYSERGRQMLPRLSVKARPFYAFVFSPTGKVVTDLKEKLQRRFPGIKPIYFSNEAITCLPVLNEKLKSMYSYKKPPETPYHWQMFDPELFNQHNPASVALSIKCSLETTYPVSELNFTLAPEYYRWQNGRFQKVEGLPSGFKYELISKQPPDRSSMQSDLIFYIPKDNGGDYGFYHFKLTAAPKELHEDYKELSTRDDREHGQADRTFRFWELVSAIAEVHFKTNLESKASPTIFMTVDNH